MNAKQQAEPPRIDQSSSISEFAGRNARYYIDVFARIQGSSGFAWVFNNAAALLGPLWGALRGAWGYFWTFAILELLALVQLGRGLWGDLGADKIAEAERLRSKSASMLEQAKLAIANGESADHMEKTSENLQRAADAALVDAQAAAAGATTLLLIGLLSLFALRLLQGFYANSAYERQYTRWRTERSTPNGSNMTRALLGGFMLLLMIPLTLYRFTVSSPDARVTSVPVDRVYYTQAAKWLDAWFDRTALAGKGLFDGITAGATACLDAVEVAFVGTPWPVVMIFLLVVAWRVAGIRVAIFTAAALAYLGLMGFWEKSMITVSLVSAAAIFCIAVGVPLGVWFSRSERAYALARPVLDLMQTMPAFVYLIPIIAFFGTGKVPGILATIIFSLPPVVRLTALGLREVPESVKEASRAFGATKWQMMRGVELPLATPAIMTGVNQTILMCLSMVVIASLIGAKGLGQDVLIALQYVAKGQGILAGLAILFCAMVMDRIVQGRFQRQDET